MTEVLSAPAERFDLPLVRKHPQLLPAGLRLECGPGWGSLLDDLFQSIQAHVEASQADQPTVARVKEKFGSLRVSMRSSDPVIADLVDKACARSASTCEICGGVGAGVFEDGWQRNRCAKHRDTPAPWL